MSLTVVHARMPAEIEDARGMFKEYQSSIGVDLCFQNFEQELKELPGEYSEPRGCILLARVETKLAGCVALRPLSSDICEMKRMYVRPSFRGQGLGRTLAENIIAEARKRRYRRMRLDSLSSMKEALFLYQSLGFVPIDAYRPNPVEGAVFLELNL